MMKKTLVAMTLVVTVMSLAGCGSTSDNSEVLAEIAILREEMNGGFERLEIQPSTVFSEQAPAEEPTETKETQEQAPAEEPAETKETQEQAPAEEPAETEETQKQAPATELQVYVVNNNNLIPVKVVEGTLSSDCVHNPTDLGCPDGGYYRDLNFIFFGKKVSQVNWVNGNTFENKEAYFPKAQNATTSHLYFCMDEENSNGKADGVYCFTAITEDGKAHSYSIQYYKNDIIH